MDGSERWQRILEDIEASPKCIELLPNEESVCQAIYEQYSIRTESLLGLLIAHTGGIVIDHWLRLYGGGEINFLSRNQMVPLNEIVVAEDILGGLFICLDNGHIGYFAPDCLELEDMEIGFGQFLYWCLQGDTDLFYKDYRWQGWQEELSALRHDSGVAFYPFLWARADSLESRHRSMVPMQELIALEFDFLKQTNNKT